MSTMGYSPVRRVHPVYQLLAGPVFWVAAILWDYQPWKLPVTVLWFAPVCYWLSQRSHQWAEPAVRPHVMFTRAPMRVAVDA